MQVVFRLRRNPAWVGKPPFETGLIGVDWLEVIAITPAALAKPDTERGEWCAYTVVSDCLCNTPGGLMSIRKGDLDAVIESGEMILDELHH